jgi:hypothetical protein
MLVAFAKTPQGEQLIATAVEMIVDRVLMGRGLAPLSRPELDGHAGAAVDAVAARAQASGEAFDAAVAASRDGAAGP